MFVWMNDLMIKLKFDSGTTADEYEEHNTPMELY